jgi:alpha-L-fucosidase
VHQLQPECLVNGRVGNQVGDYASTRDNAIPASVLAEMDWETPATINDTWGYKRDDSNWKTPRELIRNLVDIVSKGGNYLLNVGPTAEGIIPLPSVERLEAMGKWLERNGDAVFGTRAGPIHGLDWARSTASGNSIYVHVFDWPSDGQLRLPEVPGRVTARLLVDSAQTTLHVQKTAGGTVVQGPARAPDPIDTVVVLEPA